MTYGSTEQIPKQDGRRSLLADGRYPRSEIAFQWFHEYVITKRGVPFAKLSPVESREQSALGFMRGTVLDSSGLLEPDDEPWGESESDPLNQP